MKKFATADCETDPFIFGRIPKPFIWGFYDDVGFRYFYETCDFLEYISKYEGIIYLHNGGKFDIHFLFDGLLPQENVMIINGRIAKIKIGLCELRDSYLLLPVPLAAYKKDEIEYTKFEKEVRHLHMNEICNYLEGDCKYLYEILSAQFAEYGMKLTLPASAFDYWHKNFSEFKRKPKTSQYFFKQFNQYYYGGRVECFDKGIINKEFEVYDINSAYPMAMISTHPYGDEYRILRELPEIGLEQCFIDMEAISAGALPFRSKVGLSFPSDSTTRNYKITGWELKTALKYKKVKIVRINKVYKFMNSISFEKYVEHFFKMKSELKGVDDAKYLLSKLYLNSLYGKFGQSSLDHKEFNLIEPKYIEGYINEGYSHEGECGKLIIVSKNIDENKMNFYNVAVAASITGCVRAFLFEQIINTDKPIYCDTDSIAGIGFNNIQKGSELGQWNKEGDFSGGAIGGKKLYAFKYLGKNKYKISSKGAKLNHNEIISIAKGAEITYNNSAPTFSIGKKPNFVVRKIRQT